MISLIKKLRCWIRGHKMRHVKSEHCCKYHMSLTYLTYRCAYCKNEEVNLAFDVCPDFTNNSNEGLG